MDHSQLDQNRSTMAQLKCYEETLIKNKLGTSRHNEPLQAVIENKLHDSALTETNNSVLERNRALLQYIATIANSNSDTDIFNYEFVETLITGGADINIADRYGQTIFHEVARSWNIDVAGFLLKHGCNINKKDSFGRTPLHVAAAVDHVRMTEFLLQNNAEIDARTVGEYQAPIHYAAKNGAVKSLKMLLGFSVNIDSVDGKQRTSIHLAAEWTRVETAKVLINEGAASCYLDSSGNSALCVLIDRLPSLALDALSQLHKRDIISMQDSYYLQFLEKSREKVETKATRTPLETAVTSRKFEVVTHPVMQRLIYNKWVQFGRLSTIFDVIFHIIFGIAWTSVCLGTPEKGRNLYIPIKDQLWRVILGIFVVLLTAFDIGRHINATRKSHKSQMNWISWRLNQLEEDMKYCHPRWPQEQKYIQYEIKRVKSISRYDSLEAWFYFEWIILMLIVATIISHFMFYEIDTTATRYVYTRTISIVNLLVWLRLLKYFRPFPGIGTLVIILGETTGDFVNWAFLFCLLLVPFTAAFWINFGEVSLTPVHDFDDTSALLHSMLKMAVGDDFNLEGIAHADSVMAYILVVLYVTAMTIVTLNLLIALLTDTFSRVYGNAVANTIMQRAIKVVEAERTLRKKDKLKYQKHMKDNCSPEVIKMSFDGTDYVETASGRVEQQTYSKLGELKRILDDRFSKVYGRNKMSDFDAILGSVKELKDDQEEFSRNIRNITDMVKMLTGNDHKSRGSKSKNDKPNNGSGTITSLFGRFSLKNNNANNKAGGLSRRNKRSSWESDSQSEKAKSSKIQQPTSRRSDRAKARKSGSSHSRRSVNTEIVPYERSLRGRKENNPGIRNKGYMEDTEKSFDDQDDISL